MAQYFWSALRRTPYYEEVLYSMTRFAAKECIQEERRARSLYWRLRRLVKKMLLKNTIRKIKKSFGRYLSLLIIIFLGVGFYTGITTAIPDIQDKQSSYYEETNLADLKITSTLGFTDSDIEAIHLTGVTSTLGTYSKDVLVGENAVRIHAIETKLNNIKLIEGRLPKKDNECLADSVYYKVGDKIKVNEDYEDNLIK